MRKLPASNPQQPEIFNNEQSKTTNHEEAKETISSYQTTTSEAIRYKSLQHSKNRSGSNKLWQEDDSPRPVGNRLEGEFSTVERQFSKVGMFNFYGSGNKVNSALDVAYIFRNLEKEAVEHAFAVYVDKKKNYQVQWLGMGGITGVVVDQRVMIQGANLFNAEKIYFVHNHPSGNLKTSAGDTSVLKNLTRAFENLNIEIKGIIINLDSGKFLLFDEYSKSQEAYSVGQDKKEVEILAFNKVAFLLPPTAIVIKQSTDIARFLSQQRFSSAEKTGYLILSQSGEIVANFFATKSATKEMVAEIAGLVGKYGGTALVAYTNHGSDLNKYSSIKRELSHFNINLLDVVQVESSKYVYDNYKSLTDLGLLQEAKIEYANFTNELLVNDPGRFYQKSAAEKRQMSNDSQLSLFDTLLPNINVATSEKELSNTLKNTNNGNNNLSNSEGNRRPNLRTETEPGNRDDGITGIMGGEGTIQPDKIGPAPTLQPNDGEGNPGSIIEQIGNGLQGENGNPSAERLAGNRSEGSGMVEPDRTGRTGKSGTQGVAGNAPTLLNYHSTEAPKESKSFSKRSNYQDNINALNLINQLENEKRNATPDEQKILAKYVGFGGLKEILLNPANEAEWGTKSDADLKTYVKDIYQSFNQLDPDGSLGMLQAAKRSIINAHFTSYPIVNAIWEVVSKAGFKGGNVLEPSAGIGNFLAAMPESIANNSNVTAIEMDMATGKILQRLFPTAETHITGFEKINLPENHFDLVISNIPFGDVAIYDTQLERHRDKRFAAAADNIHNYFFAKSMLLTKPGGMVAFVTSRYTMDNSQNNGIRELMKDTCDFVGAIRMPDNAFKANAGTEVVADIIFLRKFNLGEERIQKHSFENTRTIPFTDANQLNGLMTYNEYFHDHPTHMIGKVEFGGLYNKEGFNLKGEPTIDLQEAIVSIGEKMIPEQILKSHAIDRNELQQKKAESNFIAIGQFDTIGNIVTLENGFAGVITGEYFINAALDKQVQSIGINPGNIRNNTLSGYDEENLQSIGLTVADFQKKVVEPVRVNKIDQPKLQYIEPIRRLTKELLFKELNNFNDNSIEKTRADLNKAYFNFVSRFSNLLHTNNKKVIGLDIDAFVIQSLENRDRITGKISPADILSKRTLNPIREVTQTDNVQDAITLSLQRHGKLNMNYVPELMGKSYKAVMETQSGPDCSVFLDENNNHLTREEYLSGNVVEKLARAKMELQMAEDAGVMKQWQNNVEHLEKVQPKPILATDIYSPLHARWLPKVHIHSFLAETLKTDSFSLGYSKSADQYAFRLDTGNAITQALATKRKSAAWIINHALNGIEPIVTYTEEDAEGNQRTLLDGQDTHFAKEQYRKVKASWDDWKFKDMNRRNDLADIYNKTYNNTVLRPYDGTHLTFPGLAGYRLRQHQKDAVFRNVQALGGINDHMVGAGKTLVQACTAMELRRLAIANKPMIIGLKSQVPQLYNEFKKAYPLAKVLFPTEKDFTKDNRQRLLNNIATNEWDCIILSHDQFNAIRQPVVIQEKMITELTDEIRDEISATNDKQEKKSLESRLYKYEQKLAALQDVKKDTQVLDFAQLGIDFLMVDESQEFKNLEFNTSKRNVRGLGNPIGSKKAFNMLVACRHLQELHKGDKGVLFCSGTPISNTMAELYLLLKYQRPNKMKECGLTSFDRWAANFANDYSDLEYYMGKFKEVHRFREFANLPELVTMYREIADVRNQTNLVLDRPKAEHSLVKIYPSETQLAQIEKLQEFIATKGVDHAESLGLTAGYDSRKGINPSFAILAINYAKKLSLDPRLIDPSFDPGTKLVEAAGNIAKIYKETSHFNGTQLVFCDLGTPKSNNVADNLYSFLEADTSLSDMRDIFGDEYHEQTKKPDLKTIKEKIGQVITLSASEVESLVQKANTAENFNVYAETKNLLLKNGIPNDHIVFIHDYNTRKQKEALFEAVNKGEIRIVLGSTKKLGTGVNVHEKCVAAHHLDISWKPSDIEQRNGRLERQGNLAAKEFMENKVQCFYYATERTLDASMYNIVSQKARFIAQIKTSDNPELRTIKDIEEDVDMGSMAAELSGDPIFKEKANLQKRMNELTLLEKSFTQRKFNIEDNIRHAHILHRHYEQRIQTLEKAIPMLEQIPKDEKGINILEGKVKNMPYDKMGEFGTAIIAEAEYAKKYKEVGSAFCIAELWGFKAIAQVQIFMGEKEVVRQVVSPAGDKIGQEKLMPKGDMAAGLQIRQTILEMPEALLKTQKSLAETVENIAQYKSQMEESFPFKDELNEKTGRLEEVNRMIMEKLKEEEKVKVKREKEELSTGFKAHN
jgi:N12 class adenine-specific DNA methylase